ncbi:MAG TPA: EamA family transporter [Propioniciclava tarda]|nr:EamA family transporter [Propioniciclava tarda]HQA31128.1 EamA family transporter [Propioniciclava tarda]
MTTDASALPRPTSRLAVWVALAIVYVVWGSTYLAIRVVVRDLPPLLSAGVRFLAGGLILGVILALTRPGSLRVTLAQLRNSALVGVLLMGGNGFVSLAETPTFGVASGVAALLVALVPLIIVVMRAATGERPALPTVAGVLCGFAGLAVLLAPGASEAAPLVGSLLVAAGALTWAAGSFYAGRSVMPANPFVSSVYQMIAGGVMLTLIGLGRGEVGMLRLGQVGADAWFALVYLLVAGSLIAFTAYAWLIQRAPVSLVTTYAYVNPIIAVLLGWALLSEPFGVRELLGGAIIVAGVALVIATERRGR